VDVPPAKKHALNAVTEAGTELQTKPEKGNGIVVVVLAAPQWQ